MTELDTVLETAARILASGPDPVVRFRLLRDVLRHPHDDPEVLKAQEGLANSRWVWELEHEQLADGSWGRFHTRDHSAKQRIPTTEAAVERALAVGLDADHPVLSRASRYVTGILNGSIDFPDYPEKNDRWPTGMRLFSASTLARIQPSLLVLDDVGYNYHVREDR